MGDSDGFQLLSAVRYDTDRPWQSLLELPLKEPLDRSSPILLVSYHRDRMASAGDAFGWPEAVSKLRSPSISQDIITLAEESILKDGSSRLTGAYKIRPVVYPDGRLEVTVAPIPPRPFDILAASALTPPEISPWLSSLPSGYSTPLVVVLDTLATVQSAFTSYKTTNRDPYSAARDRTAVERQPEPTEVILYNEKDEITEGSLRNVSLWRDGGWVTPPSTSGGIGGTIRRWVMEQGRIREQVIRVDELVDGEWVLLSNAVEGCSIGRFKAS